MGAIKLKHTSGNGTILNSPAANPTNDITLKLPSTTGSAGQVLSVASANHSSTNAELEFAALSIPSAPDFVKLQQASSGGGANSYLQFDNLDVATYKYFDFIISLVAQTDDVIPRYRFRTGGASGSSVSASDYGYAFNKLYTSNSGSDIAQKDQDHIKLADNIGNNTGNGEGFSMMMRMSFNDSNDNGASGALSNFVTWQYTSKNDGANTYTGAGQGSFYGNQNTYPTGFRVYLSSGAINAHTYALYGLKR